MGFPFNPDPKKEAGRYGFGTTEAVEALIRRLQATADTSMMVAINIATLIRNAADTKQTKAEDVVAKVRSQMNGIANELADICHSKWKARSHHILFYMCNTEKPIPQQHRRPTTSPTHALIDSATRMFLREVKPGDQEDNRVYAHVRLSDQMLIPSYKGIRDEIDKLTQPGVELHLISHMPLDYHVTLSTGRVGYLYRSHTGQVVKMTPEYLGNTVFKNPQIPFYPSTHVLLGDKYLIKGSLSSKEKRMLTQYAEKEHWSMHTNTYVKSKIKEYRFVLPYELG